MTYSQGSAEERLTTQEHRDFIGLIYDPRLDDEAEEAIKTDIETLQVCIGQVASAMHGDGKMNLDTAYETLEETEEVLYERWQILF